MTEIIERWLGKHVGVYVKMDSEFLGDVLFDGLIFAKLLVSFDVCSSEYLHFLNQASTPRGALNNLRKLCAWFKLLGVSHGDDFLKEIAHKNRASCLRLLYELFVILENKERMYFINDQKAKRLLSESKGRFETQISSSPFLEQEESEEDILLKKLEEESKPIVERFEKNTKSFIEKCIADSKKRREAIEKLSRKRKSVKFFSKEISKPPCRPCELDAMEEIRKFENNLKTSARLENNEDVINCSPSEYISLLKIRRRKSGADKYLKSKMERAAMCDAWTELLKEQEKKFHEDFSNKLLKQSDYEKQMTLRLSRINLLYKKFQENRRMIYDNANVDAVFDVDDLHKCSDENKNYYREKAKVLELHKILFNEKIQMKNKIYYNFCWIILEDIVDFAMIISDFQNEFKIELTKDSPKFKEWSTFFCKGIRLLEHFPLEDSAIVSRMTKIEDDFEDVIELDAEKMETIAEKEFDMYLNLYGDWYMEEIFKIPSQFKEFFSKLPRHNSFAMRPKNEDLNMIGYIIHRLLDMKYPYCLPKLPSGIKDYGIKVLLKPIHDSGVIAKLRMLLEKSKIAVIEVSAAINYVIGLYKESVGHKEAKEIVKKRAGRKNTSNNSVLFSETKEDKKIQFKSKLFPSAASDKGNREISTQYPSETSIIDEEDLNVAIALGGLAFSFLTEGRKLPDSLICKIIIQYIKNLKKINGWVLVDYPETLVQAAILEFLFSSKEVPFMSDITSNIQEYINLEMRSLGTIFEKREQSVGLEEGLEEESILKEESVRPFKFSNQLEFDDTDYIPIAKLKKIKNSILLPRPIPECPPIEFESFFNKIIELAQMEKIAVQPTSTSLVSHESETTASDEIESESIELNLNTFYESLGLSIILKYKSYDLATLKILARLILENINEPEVTRKCSADLFGSEVLENLDKAKKITKQHGTNKSFLNKGTASVFKNYSILMPQKPGDNVSFYDFEELIEEEEDTYKHGGEFLVVSHPGFPNWDYTNLPIEISYQIPLATVWEATEFFYIYNMKESLALLKSIDSKVYFYRQYIRKNIEECVTREDDRKQVAINFQVMLNGIDPELRCLKSMKNELHCRIFELQNKLEDMSLTKKNEAENLRENLINQNWLPDHLIKLIHGYRCMLQTEVDRFIDTMQIIQDYHMLCLSKPPSDFRLIRISIPNITWTDENMKDDTANELTNTKTKFRKLNNITNTKKKSKENDSDNENNVYQTEKKSEKLSHSEFNSSIAQLLHEPSIEKELIFSAHFIWQNIISTVFDTIMNVKQICIQKINEEAENRKQKGKKESKGKLKIKPKPLRLPTVDTEPEDPVVANLNLEWEEALEEELDRVSFRIQLILLFVTAELRNQLLLVHSVFHEFANDVNRQFVKEMTDIRSICYILKIAIEEERRLESLMVLDVDGFYIDPNIILFPQVSPPPPTPLMEYPNAYRFTISQLTNFMYKMMYVSPEGLIEQSFIHILEDMILMNHESEHQYLPHAWSQLDRQDIHFILRSAFGDSLIVNWKDFIIYSLEIKCPSLEDVLRLREDFKHFDPDLQEVVTYEQYASIIFWFETYLEETTCENLRLAKIKDLLFKLFQVNKNEINYTALLLAFCKDVDPKFGFAKALGLIDGQRYICRKDELLLKPRIVEEERKEALRIVREVVVDLLHRVFYIGDNVRVTDLEEDDQFISKCLDEYEYSQMLSFVGNRNDNSDELQDGESSTKDEQEEKTKIQSENNYLDYPWHSHVKHDTVLSLLTLAHHFYALSTDHTLKQTNLEDNLKNVFDEKGNNNELKLYVLLETPFMIDYFELQHCFQSNSLSNIVMKLLESKQNIVILQ